MQKRIAIILIAILFIVVGLCGCITEQDNQNDYYYDDYDENDYSLFIGTWKMEEKQSMSDLFYGIDVFIFFSDSTFSTNTIISGIHQLKDGKFVLTMAAGNLVYTFDYYFSNNYQKLTLMQTGGTYSFTLMKQS